MSDSEIENPPQEGQVVNENADVGRQQQKNKRGKYERKNFNPDGTVSKEKRAGKSRTDTYYVRARTVIRKCEDLQLKS